MLFLAISRPLTQEDACALLVWEGAMVGSSMEGGGETILCDHSQGEPKLYMDMPSADWRR